MGKEKSQASNHFERHISIRYGILSFLLKSLLKLQMTRGFFSKCYLSLIISNNRRYYCNLFNFFLFKGLTGSMRLFYIQHEINNESGTLRTEYFCYFQYSQQEMTVWSIFSFLWFTHFVFRKTLQHNIYFSVSGETYDVSSLFTGHKISLCMKVFFPREISTYFSRTYSV